MTKNLGPAPAPAIPGLEILERLGEGGMGVVYKARQVAMDRFVAVKVLRDELQQEPEYIKRFFKEARLAGRLRHANIVSALDCGSTADGRSFMVMEYVEGKPLDRMLKTRGALPEPEALHIARGIAEAIQYAWFHHVIHRDLKPQNVLMTREGLPKVSDFGLCRDIRDLPHLTSLGLIHCTPEYSSPEQARGDKDIDVRADLYSLGVTLYEMLTGKLPFEATDAATMIVRHAMDRPRPPRDRNPGLSENASQLVLDLLEKAKEERPPAPAMVIERLKSIASSPRSTSSSTSTARRITRAWRGTQRRSPTAAPGPSLVAAIGIVVAGIILLAAWAFRGGSDPSPQRIVRTPPVAGPKSVPPADVNVTPEELRVQNLARFLRAFESSADGSVNHWLVLGPLTNPEDRALDSPVARQAESSDPIPGLEFARSDGVMARWVRHEASSGSLEFSDAIGLRDDATSVTVLAACWIECPENKSVELRFSATGGYEFQLDRRVLAAAPSRSKQPSEPFRQKIVLGKGWHSILIKADRLEGRLAVQLRIVTPEGERLPGIRVWH